MDDFVRVGGLAAVSAALPRALRPWGDVGIMLPGYLRPAWQPLCDESGRDWPDNDIRFGRLASAAAELAEGILDKDWGA